MKGHFPSNIQFKVNLRTTDVDWRVFSVLRHYMNTSFSLLYQGYRTFATKLLRICVVSVRHKSELTLLAQKERVPVQSGKPHVDGTG
jgi:hypothetical protein